MASLGFDVFEEHLGKTKAYGLLAVILGTLLYSIKRVFANHVLEEFLEEQPCPARTRGPLSWTRATIRSAMGTPQMVAEGYEKYAKKGIPFVVPNIRKGAYLVIPPAHFKAVLSKPESVVEAHAPQFENISAAYTMRDPEIYPSNYDVDVVKKQITKRFGSVSRELAEEIALAFDEHWGLSSEWRDVKVWLSLQDIAACAMNRVMVGIPLCRNKDLLKHVMKYSISVPEAGIPINILPSFLQPLLGPLIAKKGTNHCEAAIQIYLPLVEERLNQFHSDQKASGGRKPPNDMLQWLIEESATNRNPHQMHPRRIAHRLVMLNFNAVPPTGLTLSNVLFDFYSAPASRGFVEQLRNEVDLTLKQEPEGHWTKEAVSKLHLMDSTIRESMRHSDFGSTAFPRRVASASGIDIGGIQVPHGTHMEIPMHAIHMDSDLYSDPKLFEPFRFAPKEALPPNAGPRAGEMPRPLITIEETFLGFGYGRSGCPGRFFASHLLKVMFAYIVQNYDIEYMEARPKMIELMEFRFPNENSTVRVRRRTSK